MIAALVAANRFPGLEPYALERNAVSYSLFVLLALLPVLRFMKRPREMFVAGIIAWVIFSAGYNFAGLFFRSLFDLLRTPLEVLTEGAVVYGVAAVLSWVIIMIIEARGIPSRRDVARPCTTRYTFAHETLPISTSRCSIQKSRCRTRSSPWNP